MNLQGVIFFNILWTQNTQKSQMNAELKTHSSQTIVAKDSDLSGSAMCPFPKIILDILLVNYCIYVVEFLNINTQIFCAFCGLVSFERKIRKNHKWTLN